MADILIAPDDRELVSLESSELWLSCDDEGMIECYPSSRFTLPHDGELGDSPECATTSSSQELLDCKASKRGRHRLKNFVPWILRKVKYGLLADRMKESDETESTATQTTIATDGTGSSLGDESFFSLSDDEDDDVIPLIQKRLMDTGLFDSEHDFEFVPDCVSKEVVGLWSNETIQEFGEHQQNSSHVKTGVWEVQCLNDDGSVQDKFYVVTAVSMSDRVDTKKLRKVLFAGKSYKRRPKLTFAPQKIGEKLTGFKSGTMMPICHSENMKLIVEQSIAERGIDNNHRVLCGSGMFGKCLSLPLVRFLEVARDNPAGLEVCPLIQKKK